MGERPHLYRTIHVPSEEARRIRREVTGENSCLTIGDGDVTLVSRDVPYLRTIVSDLYINLYSNAYTTTTEAKQMLLVY